MPDQLFFRSEHDLLGDREVPSNVYYGVQTHRAMENFSITDIPLKHFPELVIALAAVKKVADLVFAEGLLTREALDEILKPETMTRPNI